MAQAIAQITQLISVELTFEWLVCAYATAHNDKTDLILRKRLPAFETHSAWTITRDEAITAHQAMISFGYKSTSANRSISALGSCY